MEDKFKPKLEKDISSKLRGMVAKDMMTSEVAREKLLALQAIAATPTLQSETPDDEKAMGLKIRDMVAKGKITPEEAREKLGAWKAKVGMPMELRDMVAKGKITPEEAHGKLAAWKTEAATPLAEPIDEKDIGLKLRDMVDKGNATSEEARQRFVAWKAKVAMSKLQLETPDDEKAVGLKLSEMVAKGIITPEQGRAKMATWQAKVAKAPPMPSLRKDKGDDEAAMDKVEEGETPDEENNMGAKLRDMIAKGAITPEQARQKMAAWQTKGPLANMVGKVAIGLKLRWMVAEGKVTPEEARQKMAAWNKRAAMDKVNFADKSDEKIMGLKPGELIAEGEAKQHQHHHQHHHPHHPHHDEKQQDRPHHHHHHGEQQEQHEQQQDAVVKREDAHSKTAAWTKRAATGHSWDSKRQDNSSFGSKLRKMIARGLVVVAENSKDESKDVFAV
jgi:polyhydroxyalkanoate synthesis regulator phasin